jgi:hypothetical protein
MDIFFNPETGMLRLDEIVLQKPTFQKIMEDNLVTDEEVAEQSQLVIEILKELENNLPDEHKLLVANAMGEMAVLQVITRIQEIQELNKTI